MKLENRLKEIQAIKERARFTKPEDLGMSKFEIVPCACRTIQCRYCATFDLNSLFQFDIDWLIAQVRKEREERVIERAEAIHGRQHDCTFTDADHRRAYYFVAQAEIEREDEME